jgi:hypothetical protein
VQVLRHVYNAVDTDRCGSISKPALLAACRSQPQVRARPPQSRLFLFPAHAIHRALGGA